MPVNFFAVVVNDCFDVGWLDGIFAGDFFAYVSFPRPIVRADGAQEMEDDVYGLDFVGRRKHLLIQLKKLVVVSDAVVFLAAKGLNLVPCNGAFFKSLATVNIGKNGEDFGALVYMLQLLFNVV